MNKLNKGKLVYSTVTCLLSFTSPIFENILRRRADNFTDLTALRWNLFYHILQANTSIKHKAQLRDINQHKKKMLLVPLKWNYPVRSSKSRKLDLRRKWLQMLYRKIPWYISFRSAISDLIKLGVTIFYCIILVPWENKPMTISRTAKMMRLEITLWILSQEW